MKQTLLVLLVLTATLVLPSCDKKDKCPAASAPWTNRIDDLMVHNRQKITIHQGLAGTLTGKTGNCMPGLAENDCETGGCREFPLKDSLYVYSYTISNQATRDNEGYYTSVSTVLVARIAADNEGFFQVSLAPGTYSLFIRDGYRLYANSSDGSGGINPVTVTAGNVTYNRQTRDKAVY